MNISTRGSLNGESGDLTFTVGGMDCGSCAAKIETALSRLPGVADVKVSVARERLNLSLAEDKTSVAKIEDTLRKLGFKPALLPQDKAPREKIAAEHHDHGHDHDHSSCGGHHHAEAAPSIEQNNALTFSVGGMDCGSCAAKIETALSRLPGVADVKVSVARERLNLSLADNKTPVDKIEDTLRKLGFKPALLPQEKPHSARSKNIIMIMRTTMTMDHAAVITAMITITNMIIQATTIRAMTTPTTTIQAAAATIMTMRSTRIAAGALKPSRRAPT